MNTIILKYVSRNLDTLINFLNGLDDHIDAYIKKQEAETAVTDAQIASLEETKAKQLKAISTAQNLRGSVQGITKS